ncbi:MAG: hypothetical protein ACXACW_15975 [Candidatus Hodarchaeales archaeon]
MLCPRLTFNEFNSYDWFHKKVYRLDENNDQTH